MKTSILSKIYNNKRVLVTGHTGFKGSWLTILLKVLESIKGEPHGDYEYALNLIVAGKYTGYIKDPISLDRRHPGQTGRSSFQLAIEGKKLFDNVYAFGLKLKTIDRKTPDEVRLWGLKFFYPCLFDAELGLRKRPPSAVDDSFYEETEDSILNDGKSSIKRILTTK